MKKVMILLLAMGALLPSHLSAQSSEAKEKIESARIALITQRLGLTPKQAEQFWPIYNEYTQKMMGMKKEFDAAKNGLDRETATEAQKKELLNMGMRIKENRLQLERNYSDRLLKVITTDQILSLRNAEEDFRKLLLEQIRKRRLQQERREIMREKIQDRRELLKDAN